MEKLRGYLVRWEAPNNKGDAARYWGHTGTFTLKVLEDADIAVRNAVGGVILRATEEISEGVLEAYLGAEVEVEGEYDQGRVVAEQDAEERSPKEADAAVQSVASAATAQEPMALASEVWMAVASGSDAAEPAALASEDSGLVASGPVALPMMRMGRGVSEMAQTLMVPHRWEGEGRVVYGPAPRYEGAGFRVYALRRC
ncbi:hypothetical protein L6R29_13375 [Myxococcota bacterium]|nr:hypothetical protein [Myxococcota bacterium]